MRTTPTDIKELTPNEIIIFGSNWQGLHLGGLAKYCHANFGAEWGIGYGRTGQCYAINTMDGLKVIRNQIVLFIDYAKSHPELTFLVTEIGTGIAGHKAEDIAPLFKACLEVCNIHLPESFCKTLKQ